MLEGQGNFTYHKLAGQTGLQYPRKKNHYMLLKSSGCMMFIKLGLKRKVKQIQRSPEK